MAGRTADANDEMAGPAGQGGGHQFTCAVGGGVAGVALVWRQKGQPGGRRHLDDGGMAASKQPKAGLQLGPPGQGAAHPAVQQAAAAGCHQGCGGALTAVGQGQGHTVGVRQDPLHPNHQGPADLFRAQGTLEGIGSQQDLHGCWGWGKGLGRQELCICYHHRRRTGARRVRAPLPNSA